MSAHALREDRDVHIDADGRRVVIRRDPRRAVSVEHPTRKVVITEDGDAQAAMSVALTGELTRTILHPFARVPFVQVTGTDGSVIEADVLASTSSVTVVFQTEAGPVPMHGTVTLL